MPRCSLLFRFNNFRVLLLVDFFFRGGSRESLGYIAFFLTIFDNAVFCFPGLRTPIDVLLPQDQVVNLRGPRD